MDHNTGYEGERTGENPIERKDRPEGGESRETGSCHAVGQERAQCRTRRYPLVEVPDQQGRLTGAFANGLLQAHDLTPPLPWAKTQMRDQHAQTPVADIEIDIDCPPWLTVGLAQVYAAAREHRQACQQEIAIMATMVAKIRAGYRAIAGEIHQVLKLRRSILIVVAPVDLLQADHVGLQFSDHG